MKISTTTVSELLLEKKIGKYFNFPDCLDQFIFDLDVSIFPITKNNTQKLDLNTLWIGLVV